MKFIANILTDKPFKDNDLYNVVSDKNNLIGGIPTLVVGWEYTKKLYPMIFFQTITRDKSTTNSTVVNLSLYFLFYYH